jgi:hypothetical protein
MKALHHSERVIASRGLTQNAPRTLYAFDSQLHTQTWQAVRAVQFLCPSRPKSTMSRKTCWICSTQNSPSRLPKTFRRYRRQKSKQHWIG